MNKLKTLKDIPLASKKYTDKKLRQEAIKWWKAIENGDVENEDCQGFIELFLNIIKDDLK